MFNQQDQTTQKMQFDLKPLGATGSAFPVIGGGVGQKDGQINGTGLAGFGVTSYSGDTTSRYVQKHQVSEGGYGMAHGIQLEKNGFGVDFTTTGKASGVGFSFNFNM